MHFFTEEQGNYIRNNAKGIGNAELTEKFNNHFALELGINQIKAYKKNHKISSGLTGTFNKGSIPWNKGMKGLQIGGKESQFKKGHKPHNWVPIGSERITKDGYIQIKIKEGKFQHNWRGKHILIWEEHNGPLPKGHVIIFGDGDNRNFDINNLILVSRAQLLILNSNDLIKNNAEITRVGINIAKLHQKIFEKRR